MSLDISLYEKPGTGVFVRRNGSTVELTEDEVRANWPDWVQPAPNFPEAVPVYEANITHNLSTMAMEVGVYRLVWRPDENGVERAQELVQPLNEAVAKINANPEHFDKFNPSNGWGDREGLVRFLTRLRAACELYPDAMVVVSR